VGGLGPSGDPELPPVHFCFRFRFDMIQSQLRRRPNLSTDPLVTKSQGASVSEALEDAHNGAEGDDAEEAAVGCNLDDLVLGFFGFGLVVDLVVLDVLGGRFHSFGVGLGCG
jgi:hypothetical protein